MRAAFVALVLGGCDCGAPAECPPWSTVVDDADPDDSDLGCSVLSVWGDAYDDTWFSGGTLGAEPQHACALHFDGHAWERLAIDVPATLWWVTTTPESTWFVGEEGTIVRWQAGAATTFDSGVTATLYGVWGAREDDVWAVGGDAGGETDVILHFDGGAWTRVPPPEALGVQLFKVWGSAADDAWIVGTGGVVLHYDGAAWATHTILTDSYGGRPGLFTVHGRAPDDVWAVGMSSTVAHFDGTEWSLWADPSGDVLYAGLLNGVYAPVGGDVFIVGPGAVKIWIREDGSHVDETLEGTFSDFHGAWADAAGHAFAVGGNFISPSPETRDAAIVFHGCPLSKTGLP